MLHTQDPVTTAWAIALATLFFFVVAVPVLRTALALALHALARLTGRRHLHAHAARMVPKIVRVLAGIAVGIVPMTAPAVAAPVSDGLSVDRDGGLRLEQTEETRPAVYVVRTGDTLWDIAAARLTTATDAAITEEWKAIWLANRRVIGDHPELIRPGMELVLDGDRS